MGIPNLVYMKRLILLLLIVVPVLASGQVVNFAKTLPERSYNIGLTPAYHFDNNTVLFDAEGPAIALNAGYGLKYPLDFNVKYIYFVNGPDFMGFDFQYLMHEARFSYFSVIGGLHRWEDFGLDVTGLYTYAPRYFLNLSVGLDFDLSFAEELKPRFWLPVNVGLNVSEYVFVFAEYSLPVSELSWDIFAVGLSMIFR